jgi:hypothetical protein
MKTKLLGIISVNFDVTDELLVRYTIFVQLHVFLTSALDGGEWSGSCPSHFTLRERAPGTHWIGGLVGPRASLDVVMKRKILSPCWESNP